MWHFRKCHTCISILNALTFINFLWLFLVKPLLNAKRETSRRIVPSFPTVFLLTLKLCWEILSIIGGGSTTPVYRKGGRHNQRFILTQMHRRRRQHNGTRNALCCHRRRPDNLHDFSVSAQQSASRIIHSSFDLDGRHSTASHSSSRTSTSVDPKLFLHLHQSRALFILREEECSRDIISFSLAGNSN